MAEKVQNRDFVELDYTGRFTDGKIFDTTIEDVAHQAEIPHNHGGLKPVVVCVGEKQLLPGLDEELVGKEVGGTYTFNFSPEKAFGKRDIKKMRIVPMNTFKEHKVQPQPGLQIDVDGERGTVSRVSGGRVIVNFNHPLAGKEVVYDVTVRRKVTDKGEQIKTFLNTTLRMPVGQINVEIKEDKAEVEMPMKLPPQFTGALSEKMVELTGLKAVEFKVKSQEAKKE